MHLVQLHSRTIRNWCRCTEESYNQLIAMTGVHQAMKTRSIARAAELALGEVRKYFADPAHSVVDLETQRKQLIFGAAKLHAQAWKQPSKCLFPKCGAITIARSHSIPRAGSLEIIAHRRKVIAISLDPLQGARAHEVDIASASTFPGFCKAHEDQFGEFERRGELVNNRDVELQLFRTVCRGIYASFLGAVEARRAVELYVGLRKIKAEEMFASTLANRVGKRHRAAARRYAASASLSLKGGRETGLEVIIRRAAEAAAVLLSDFYPEPGTHGRLLQAVSIRCLQVGQQVPVALCGQASLPYQAQDGVRHKPMILINCLPHASGTTILLAVPRAHGDALDTYLATYLDKDYGLVDMLESWMVNGTDHWFLSPSVWGAIAPSVRLEIVSAVQSTEQTITSPSPFRILDCLRA